MSLNAQMEIKKLIKEIEKKELYKNFKKENPDSFFAAAFIVLDTKNSNRQIQFDFFIPSSNKIASFNYEPNEMKIHDDKINNMQHQTTNISIDIDRLKETCEKIIEKNKSRITPTKIIAILQNNIWNLTCMDDALGIVRIKINAISGEAKKFESGSLTDFMGIRKP